MPEFVSLEEAKLCPECKHPGRIASQNAIQGGTLLKVGCHNEECPWFQTFWFVELDQQGQVQVNERARLMAQATRIQPKLDPNFDANHEAVLRMLDRQHAEETRGGD